MRRRRLAALLAAAAIATGAASAAAVAPAAAATAPAPTQPVIVRLKAQADMSGITGTRAERLREVIRRRRALADQGYGKLLLQVAAWQRQGKITKITRFWVFNGFSLTATQDVIDALAANPLVASVEPDATGTIVPASSVPAEPNIARIGAPPVWDGGDGGEGIVVATLDSGVDIDHPDLAASWRGGADSWYDPFGQHPTTPMDRSGHGTQVMGVIAGAGYGGTAIGVAPGATWIAARIFNDAGQGSLSATHLAFQWVLDPDRDPATADAPQVVNNSWTFASGGCNLEFAQDIQSLRAAGIVPVFAAGNFTSLSASPANNPGALAVGSTTATDTIAGDSSRGPSACGEGSSTFPELTAPGVRITTADLGGFYASVTGTSIAAPHVTGALALMLSERPALTVAQQEGILEGAALDLGAAGADNTFGFGRLDAHAAHDAVLALPPPADTTGPAVSAVAAAPNPVAAGTVVLSASATDAAGIVSGAEWFEGADPGAGNGTAMYASDGAWDLLTETVRADIDAAALAPGSHTISVRARDAAGNWGAPVATTLVVDRAGPTVSSVAASPNPVSSGGVTLTATAADGDSTVTAGEWFEGADPGAGNGTALTAADGAFDAPSEALAATVAADGLAPGPHTISVRARDAAGNWGAATAATLVVDRVAPVTSAVAVSPNPVASADVTLTATAADALTSVAAAEWFEGADPGAGHGTAMTAADGAFGAATEGLRAVLPTAALAPGAHTLSVRARDAAGNWGVPAAVALTIDRSGPAASAVTATPNPTAGAATVALGATLTEPAGSAVVAAEWFDGADPGAGRGAAMAAADGAFGDATESVTASAPTAGMAPGTHVLSVRGRDAAGNWGALATVSVSVSASSAIFADGFETGLGAWSSVSGGSRVAATAAARSQGALGMQATVSGSTPAYVQDASPANEAVYAATFAFKPNGTTTNGNPTDILSALSGGTSPAQVLAVQYRRVTGPVRLQLRLSVARKGGTTTTGWYTVGEAWHTVGVTWSSGTSASATLRIDGATAETLTRLDTSARRVETARLGPSGGLASGMAGTEYFDAFTSTR